ncbi:MAG: family 10 glycosylhydrolase [Ignavibacteria bacterium]|nr:family 10 glycosylhydrolase [Ignavibacteria bacterium]
MNKLTLNSRQRNSIVHILIFAILILLPSSLHSQSIQPKREMRGAWIATVNNIDYPSAKNNGAWQNTVELRNMLTTLHNAGINTIFFQVRTECDALYKSSLEPWSYWLTGKQGQAPDSAFDPLQAVIEESHKLGMELHAWFNPYRAEKAIGNYPLSPNHVVKRHPEWLLNFKDSRILDPGLPAVQDFIIDVLSDVINHYDIDGVHFDDYFYPYGPKVSTEDSATYAKYPRGIRNIDDWRRDNINSLMARIYSTINNTKPWVKFGISPFGIVENKYANTGGFESYHILYCDPLNWINNRIVDYVLPQLYWEMEHPKAPFAKLLPWWALVTKPSLLFVGHYSSSFLTTKSKPNMEDLLAQLTMVRTTANVSGSVFFSAKSLLNNFRGFNDSLFNKYYSSIALPPLYPTKAQRIPVIPREVFLYERNDSLHFRWSNSEVRAPFEQVGWYVIYRFKKNTAADFSDPANILGVAHCSATEMVIKSCPGTGNYTYVVTTLSKYGDESTQYRKVITTPLAVE